MCNACGFLCCGSDSFDGCGCTSCGEVECMVQRCPYCGADEIPELGELCPCTEEEWE